MEGMVTPTVDGPIFGSSWPCTYHLHVVFSFQYKYLFGSWSEPSEPICKVTSRPLASLPCQRPTIYWRFSGGGTELQLQPILNNATVFLQLGSKRMTSEKKVSEHPVHSPRAEKPKHKRTDASSILAKTQSSRRSNGTGFQRNLSSRSFFSILNFLLTFCKKHGSEVSFSFQQ